MSEYQVVVGNIGTVYEGANRREAVKVWCGYRRDAKSPSGRGSGEPVTLFRDGEIVREWAPAESVAWEVEYTDTYGGEANYCWVVRRAISAPPRSKQALVMRRAKLALGLSGLRGRTSWHGDGYEFRPFGIATVVFVNWSEGGMTEREREVARM